MTKEIERKFLVDPSFPAGTATNLYGIKQGYIFNKENEELRVRQKNEQYYLTHKSNQEGITRDEEEIQCSRSVGEFLFKHCCDKVISKTRYNIRQGKHILEIDVFHGKLFGLILGEVELNYENEPFNIPALFLEEVSDNQDYYNKNLINRC